MDRCYGLFHENTFYVDYDSPFILCMWNVCSTFSYCIVDRKDYFDKEDTDTVRRETHCEFTHRFRL